MTRDEVDIAIEWAKREGWNPGIHDAECFYQTDPKGFYAAKLGGETVATISAVKYPGDFVFEGLYIVDPEFRGRGIGSMLQKYILDICRGVNLGLDGVVSMQQKYEQYGLAFAHNNTRYAAKVGKNNIAAGCDPIKRKDFDEITAFDRSCFMADRQRFLKCWLFQKEASSQLHRNQKSGGISGYGVIRKCRVGYKIGPLFAEDALTAERLFDSLTSTVPSETVFLDVPQPNNVATELATKKGMRPVFSTVRMYTKKAPNLPLNKIFGITTFELG